jgi:micrococcal nuclease
VTLRTGAPLRHHPPPPVLALVALALLLTGACACTATPGRAAGRRAAAAVMVRDVDGDTIVARVDGRLERVRLLGIDTPETKDPRKPVQCYGHEASAHTTSLLPPGTALRVARDVEARDRYGRLLLYVWRARDGLFVNRELAADGDASLLTFRPNTAHEPELSAAVDLARRRGLGLWGRCGGPGRALGPSG